MEIQKTILEQSKDASDILYDLIMNYYPDYDDRSFKKLDLVTQTFVLIVDADGQIQNGGIIGFIDNESGNRFHETIDAAKRIDSESLVDILTNVTKKYPKETVPKNWNKRRDLWDSMCEKHDGDDEWEDFWNSIDDSYYMKSTEIQESLLEYLKKNAKLID